MSARARPLVISHRTNRGTSPENSLEGIAAALRDGSAGVEIDVRASSDGVPLLLHDATLTRTYGDPRALREIGAAEARAFGIPTLAEALAAINGRATLYIEVKERDLGNAIARVVTRAHAAAWCWVWAFDPAAGAECRAALPDVPVALNSSAEAAAAFGYGSPSDVAVREGFAGVSLDRRMLTPAVVTEAHALGLLVFTWTVNEHAAIEAALAADADGICGDYPARIRAVIEAAR